MADSGARPDQSGLPQPSPPQSALLRILATTDMHMHVLPYNYLSDAPSAQGGLARVASMIRAAREECAPREGSGAMPAAVIVLDNGDVLQGNPLGDYVARAGIDRRGLHPVIAAMNAIGYDAATIGNHDFNFGLPFLRRALAGAAFPVVASNLTLRRGPQLARALMIVRRLTMPDGGRRDLRIAVMGFLPPQTAEWDIDLTGQMRCADIVQTARALIPDLRAQGADLIVALAHSGIGPVTPQPGMEHAATALAVLPGIDAVIAGHSHQVFPGPQVAASDSVDPLHGALAGTPAVMAGFGGSHLGVIDLRLDLSGPRVTVTGFCSEARPVPAATPADPLVARPALAAHRQTIRHYRRRVGHTAQPLHSYFALIGADAGLRMVNLAQRWHVRGALQGTRWQHLPVLSAAAPFRTGGRGGPDHYTDVPRGPLTLRNLSDLYAFPNRICAVVIDGHQLTDWLERSASIIAPVPAPGGADHLIDPVFPGYNFDVIEGVTWQIDLSAPARFRADGRLADADARRILDLTHRGRPVAPDDRFVLATSSYRLASCGLFSPLVAGNEVALRSQTLARDVLRGYVRRRRHLSIPPHSGWRFAPSVGGRSAVFDTGPGALPHLDALRAATGLRIAPEGHTPDGFTRLRLWF